MTDILDMLGLSNNSPEKTGDEAADWTRKYLEQSNSSTPLAPSEVEELNKVNPNIPNTSKVMDLGSPDYSKFNEASLIAQLSPSEKTNEETPDEETKSISRKVSVTGHAPTSFNTPDTTKSEGGTPQTLKDFMQQFNGDNPELKKAQEQQSTQQLIGNLGTAGAIIGQGISRHNAPLNTQVSENILKNAGQTVENIFQKHALQKEKMQTQKLAADIFDETQRRDATSPLSNAYRNLAKTLTPEIVGSPGFDAMSADEVTKAQPMIDSVYKSNMMKVMLQERMEQKRTVDSGKAKSEMGKTILTALNRGAPMQAQTSILASDKIMDLFKEQPEPSKWNSSQVHLFNTETEKLAKGGIPGERGTNKLIPPTLGSLFSKAATFATGDSIGTHQGEIIKSLVPYIQNVRQTSAQFVRKNVYDPALNTYNKRLTPEDMMNYKKSVPEYIYPELNQQEQPQGQHKQVVQDGNIFELGDNGQYHFLKKQ